jgi:transposase InsO family protein
MQKILIDYVGRFPRSKSGNTVILVCVDSFSKFAWLVPLREASTAATIKALRERIFTSFSVPEVIVMDNARCFIAREFQQFCFGMGIRHVTTSPYYPQASHAERFNRNLRAALIAYHGHDHVTWNQNLSWLQLTFETAKHESTKATPFEVIFPFRAGSPLMNRWSIHGLLPEMVNVRQLRRRWNQVRQSLRRAQQWVAYRYNRGRIPTPFKVGDLVYYQSHPISHGAQDFSAKLAPRWKGPYKIERWLTPVTARIVNPCNDQFVTRAHVSLLKFCS